jgi:prepilin-type N-terminal cleavage/methylation domain-containing protein
MQKGVKVSVKNQRGVTLIELLVVMAIIGIIVVIGVNMMGGVISKQRLRTAVGEVQTRLRVAQMLSVVKNKPVTVIFVNTPGIEPGQEDSYYACLDNNYDGDCTDAGEEYINLDSGRTGELGLANKVMHPLVEIYNVDFGNDVNATPNAVTFKPPSGLPRTIEDDTPTPGIVNGAVCFRVEAGDDGDDFKDRYVFRRISVDPLVGKAKMWKNLKEVGSPPMAITANPDCDSQLPETDTAVEWEKVF